MSAPVGFIEKYFVNKFTGITNICQAACEGDITVDYYTAQSNMRLPTFRK